MADQLLLADRGYPSVACFEAVAAHGGAFIVRLTRSYDPWIRTAWDEGQRIPVSARIRLSRFLARHAGHRVDLNVDFHCGPRVVGFRVVVLPGREAAMTRLCTNLPRTPFRPFPLRQRVTPWAANSPPLAMNGSRSSRRSSGAAWTAAAICVSAGVPSSWLNVG